LFVSQFSSISNSSIEYFAKYTISPTFTSIGALVPFSRILPEPTAITSPLFGFSLFSGRMIHDFVVVS
jgi:hypothetical protein